MQDWEKNTKHQTSSLFPRISIFFKNYGFIYHFEDMLFDHYSPSHTHEPSRPTNPTPHRRKLNEFQITVTIIRSGEHFV